MCKKDAVDPSRHGNSVKVRQWTTQMELLHREKEGGPPRPPDATDLAADRTAIPPPHGGPPGGAPPRDRGGRGSERPIGRGGGAAAVEEHVVACCDGELETSFVYVDENVNLRLVSPSSGHAHKPPFHGSVSAAAPPEAPELSLLSSEELFSDAPPPSVDYGFIGAVTFLVTGISLVIVSYAVPRQAPDADAAGVSAREMERLEARSARVGAHLDRCVIAGLCLLTLGGVVLSSLLTVSLWRGEMDRRRAFACSKLRSARLYGSTHLRSRSSPSHASAHLSLDELEDETVA